jgi:DNA-binding NarL/FixJ family response regulator
MPGEVRARVLIADDHQCFLERVARSLEGDFQVAGTAVNGRQLVEAEHALHPDVLVIDVSMPDMNGLEALAAIRRGGSAVPAVFLTASNEIDIIEAAWAAGAAGFVVKTSVAQDLVPAVQAALEGRRFLSEAAAHTITRIA